MSITIREPNPSDFEKITEYYFEFYDEIKDNSSFGLTLFDEKPTLLDEMQWFLEFQKACAEGNSIGLVAEIDGEFVGFCEVGRRKPKSPVSHRGDFGISVKKQNRGKGIGSMLLKEMIERCRGKFEVLECRSIRRKSSCKTLVRKVWIQALWFEASVC